MSNKQALAKEIFDRADALMGIIREPGTAYKIRLVEDSMLTGTLTCNRLTIEMANGDELQICLYLKRLSEPAAVSVETSAAEAENHSEPAGPVCAVCDTTPVKDEHDLCTECRIDAGGGT